MVAIPRICELVDLVSNYVHRLAKINFKLISQNSNLRFYTKLKRSVTVLSKINKTKRPQADFSQSLESTWR